MANAQHLEWLLEGGEAWNARRGDEGHELYKLADLAEVDFKAIFQDASKLGPDGQIALAGYNLSYANLADAKLHNANLAGANLEGAELRRARLHNANLTGANLEGAELGGAWLHNANLTGANLEGAELGGAWLHNANLTGANLNGADLSGSRLANSNFTSANLTDANFSRTNLSHTNLTDANLATADLTNATIGSADCTRADFGHTDLVVANLAGAKIRQGILFANNETPASCTDIPARIESIKNVIDTVNTLKLYHYTDDNHFTVYFRGESKSVWALQPSVMRDISYKNNEKDMLLDLIAKRPGDFNGIVSGVGQLVLAQHHGLKTRFLDITRNPLVALFHACANEQHHCKDAKLHVFVTSRDMVKPFISDTVSVIANYARLPYRHQQVLLGEHGDNDDYTIAMEQLFQLIQSEKPYFADRIDPKDFYRVIIVEPQQSSERVSKQAGAFLVSAFHERFERKEIEGRNEGVPPLYAHYQLIIPANAKQTILEELAMLDITRESLFPGLDESANAVNESYRKRSG